MQWFEDLPDGCPPDDARQVSGVFFRLVDGNPPACSDFLSHRKLAPNKLFSVDECQTRSLSVFETQAGCEKIRKLPLHRGKKIASVRLTRIDGVACQTGKQGHYSWWRSQLFAISTANVTVL